MHLESAEHSSRVSVLSGTLFVLSNIRGCHQIFSKLLTFRVHFGANTGTVRETA